MGGFKLKKIDEVNLPRESITPIHQGMTVGILLAIVGGFLDIYTYTLRGQVFANAQTGNMVLMGVSVAHGDWARALYYLLPIGAFALGVLVTEYLKHRNTAQWRRHVLLLEALILFAVGCYPVNAPHVVVNVIISFVCSMQVNSFRQLLDVPYATTMCTGNLRSACEQLFLYIREKDRDAGRKCACYAAIILCFCGGAAGGALASVGLGIRAIWCCCALLVFAMLVLKRGETQEVR